MSAPAFELWLEFEHWMPQEDDDLENDCFNMKIQLDDGTTYALNVWTYTFLDKVHQIDKQSGENLGGKYQLPPDLFVERLDRTELESTVADLIRNRTLRREWLIGPESR
jgi:hypothetical protein